jgi:hypothetical protein
MLDPQPDWEELVSRAVDDLMDDLPPAMLESRRVRERLMSYSLTLVAAARAASGGLRCNDGSTTVDCVFVLRPNDTPYYRCMHAPPHCYDAQFNTIRCP